MKVLAFGEVLWDVYPDKAYIGGAPLNFCGHVAKQGGEAYLFSAVGNDSLGKETLEAVRALGIHTDYVRVNDKETGKCFVTLDEKGVPSYNIRDDAAWDHIEGEISEDFDALYFGTLALRSETNFDTLKSLIAKGGFKEIFCDVNIRAPYYSEKTVKTAFENATIIKISEDELETAMTAAGIEGWSPVDAMFSAAMISAAYPNIKTVLITSGEEGSTAFDSFTKSVYYSRPRKVEVKSTVGAGDSFSASFLCSYMKRPDVDKCLRHASKVSSYVVSRYEAVPDYTEEVKLIVIRHGHSEGNQLKIFCGQLDTPLNENGFKQAEQTAEYVMNNYKVDAVYSSDLVRVTETVRPIADSLGLPINTDKRLREVDVGEWQGIPIADAERDFPEEIAFYRSNPGKFYFKGGEGYAYMQIRVVEAVGDIIKENDGKTVVVGTHGGCIRTLLAFILGISIDDIAQIPFLPNASVTVLNYSYGDFEIEKIGYSDHLDVQSGEFLVV